VGFHIDHLEFIDGSREHGEEVEMEESKVCCDKVVFVNGRWVLSFSDEQFGYVGECFGEGFDGGEFVVVVVEGFTFDNEVFYLNGDGSGETGHCSGEIFICLDLEDAFNGLQGHGHLAVVGDPFSIPCHPKELLQVHIILGEGADEVHRVLM
jgi:hypothetical protein